VASFSLTFPGVQKLGPTISGGLLIEILTYDRPSMVEIHLLGIVGRKVAENRLIGMAVLTRWIGAEHVRLWIMFTGDGAAVDGGRAGPRDPIATDL
jgi:hypothetical protein